jgi:hypothetical protein
MELGPPMLVVPSPAVKPLSCTVSTVVAPLSKDDFDLELDTNDMVFANGKGVGCECGEWLPGIQLGSQ